MQRVYRKNPALALRESSPEDIESLRQTFAGEKHLPCVSDGSSFIASIGKDDVAHFSYSIHDTLLLLTQLFVYPQFRGFGVGSMVLGSLETLDQIDGILVLSTLSSTPFYEKLGFTLSSEQLLLAKSLK